MFLPHDLDTLIEEFKDILVLFYFKGMDDQSVEFAHKSIHDYLVVKGTISLLNNSFRGFQKDRIEGSCSRLAPELYRLPGKTSFHPDSHLRFLVDILKKDRETAISLIGPVTLFLERAQDHLYLKDGLDLHKNPLVTEANLISGLFYLVTTILGHYADDEEIRDTYGSFIREKINLRLLIGLFNSIEEFGFCNRKFSFYRINLREVSLAGEILQVLNFAKADLLEADFCFAYLASAYLSGAHLEKAILRGAYLDRVDFRGANLRDADLRDANLREADLREADLIRAYLGGANLGGANLKGAILGGANLEGADLRGAIYDKKQLKQTRGTPRIV